MLESCRQTQQLTKKTMKDYKQISSQVDIFSMIVYNILCKR